MYSIGILSAILFAIFATTNALECRPVTCMLMCPFGFDVNEQGCPHCSCRQTPSVCREPIFGYNCGTIDHRDCPSSHECQLNLGGFSGQCCLKPTGSTTASPKSTTAAPKSTTAAPKSTTAAPKSTTVAPKSTTARTATTTAHGTSTRRSLNRLLASSARSTTQAQGSGSPAATTQSSVTTSRWTRPATSTQGSVTTGQSTRPATSTQGSVTTGRWTRPATSTQGSVTTGQSTRPATSTQRW